MVWWMALSAIVLLGFAGYGSAASPGLDLGTLKKGEQVSDFQLANLYSDAGRQIVGAKFLHVPSGAPVFLLQIETVPQVYMWVDTPVTSDRGLPHALEHLLGEKGVKGRYFTLLRDMKLSQSVAATWRDFNFYSLTSGSGMDGFFELFHAWMEALYHPDFTDTEAEREFYHFGVVSDPSTKIKTLTEGGSVYNEELTNEGEESCYRDLKQRVLGKDNPLAAEIGGDPEQMRDVTPREIREFHKAYYRLGPTTGFIFAIHPKEDVVEFLRKVSGELGQFVQEGGKGVLPQSPPAELKYPIHPSESNTPQICRIPGSETTPGDVWFLWKPQNVDTMIHLKLLQLFYRGLADGQRSLLHQAIVDSKTRQIDLGATGIKLDPDPSDSPRFLVWSADISGIPGTRISVESVTQVRNAVLEQIREVSEYPDHSEKLVTFNKLISSYAQAWRRSKLVWMRNPPLFGASLDANWKDFFEYLEMDASFVRSLSEDQVWTQIEKELLSGKNIWRDLIREYHLLDLPYAYATQSSPQLLQWLESEKKERLDHELQSLRGRYHADSNQEALTRFEQDELTKTKEIDAIEAQVPKPHFTEHPPLTPDEYIRYRQFQIGGVPTIATLFDRPPTLEIGLAFDIHHIPQKYYKYLPVLARSFDSLGLKEGEHIVPYAELLQETDSRFIEFAATTSDNGVSHRADFAFRASVTSVPELQEALRWIKRVLLSSYIDSTNLNRLRDVVTERLAADDSYTKQDEFAWVFMPAQAFRYQGDALYLALDSQFTKAYWDGRLHWLLHQPVSSQELGRLGAFASHFLLTAKQVSRSELGQRLSKIGANGLEGELVDHWKRNLNSFSQERLAEGLQRLAIEAQEDLRTGPVRAMEEIRELQRLVVNRRALKLDLLVSPSVLDAIQPDLLKFVRDVPDRPLRSGDDRSDRKRSTHPIIDKVAKENGMVDKQFPWHVGLVIPGELTGSAIFYSDFVNYFQTDRNSLVRLLSSAILSGRGLGSLYMKAREAGLAYQLLMRADPAHGQLGYYADRSLDVPSLVLSMNASANIVSKLREPYLIDYALQQLFSIPRAIYNFPIREHVLVQEIRDGNTPEKMRQFYQSLLKLRNDPNLLPEITRAGKDALCGILLAENCKPQQKAAHSIFFFVGSEKTLSDVEKRLPIKIVRIWPSDYWLP